MDRVNSRPDVAIVGPDSLPDDAIDALADLLVAMCDSPPDETEQLEP